jgi:plasmid stabilization system protein ParE
MPHQAADGAHETCSRSPAATSSPILDYVADRSPQGAARIHTRIRSVTDLLLHYPLAGAVTDDPTIRRITTQSVGA